jgi:hypothetical protein
MWFFCSFDPIYIDDLRSKIFALLKSLKIQALDNYVCLLRHTYTDS